jgi:hypothetical protein
MKKYIISTLAILITACSTTSEMDTYINEVTLTNANKKFVHIEHGEKTQYEEPLIGVFDKCTTKSFSGKSFKIGSAYVTDVQVLEQLYSDYSTTVVEQAILGMTKSKSQFEKTRANFNKLNGGDVELNEKRRGVFVRYTFKNDNSEFKRLGQVFETRNTCISESGWEKFKPISTS